MLSAQAIPNHVYLKRDQAWAIIWETLQPGETDFLTSFITADRKVKMNKTEAMDECYFVLPCFQFSPFNF